MMFSKEVIDLFNEDWKCSAKVVQKDIDFMCEHNETGIVGIGSDIYLNINCGDWIRANKDYYKREITDSDTFGKEFEDLCKRIIAKDFRMFHEENQNKDQWLEGFIEEQHGSGVSSLFWLFYQMKANDVKHIVIDNIDGFLHYLSMQQLGRLFKELKDYKIIFLMNNDTLFTTWIFGIEDLYVMHGMEILNIQDCTDRELGLAHDMQKLLRAGEFGTTEW